MTLKLRECAECGVEFSPKKDDARIRFCSKKCRSLDVNRRFNKDKPDYKDNYYRNNKDSYYWRALRSRAKRLGVDFDLTLDDYIELIAQTPYCPIFGTELTRSTRPGGKQDNSPSVDRFDSTKGYTLDNVFVISDRANRLKNDATVTELEKIVDWMRATQKKIDTASGRC